MLFELEGMSTAATYHLMTQVVVPRPIAWVVSDNGGPQHLGAEVAPEARWNLAPFSYFNAVASDPPTVMFSVTVPGATPEGRNGGRRSKDTLSNVLERTEHTIALPHHAQLQAVEASSAEVPFGESEFVLARLEPVAWDWPVPRPEGVRVALGCTVDVVMPIGEGTQQVVFSRLHRVWVDDSVIGEDPRGRTRIDPTLLDPLIRLGAGTYGALGPTSQPGRPIRPAD